MPYANHNPSELTKTVTINTLHKLKGSGEKFVVVALYDAPMAAMAQKCGVEVVLIGDSLGMTVLGYQSTIPVTMEQMIYQDRKSTRLNSSHVAISYAVFCL